MDISCKSDYAHLFPEDDDRHFKQYDSYEDKAMCQSDNQNDKKITEMSAVILQKKLQLEDDRERLDGRTKDWQFDSFLSSIRIVSTKTRQGLIRQILKSSRI